MTLEERIAAIERHLFGRAYTDPQVTEVPSPAADAPAEVPADEVASEVAADVAADVPALDGGPASV